MNTYRVEFKGYILICADNDDDLQEKFDDELADFNVEMTNTECIENEADIIADRKYDDNN